MKILSHTIFNFIANIFDIKTTKKFHNKISGLSHSCFKTNNWVSKMISETTKYNEKILHLLIFLDRTKYQSCGFTGLRYCL